jgi:hypothetical protein
VEVVKARYVAHLLLQTLGWFHISILSQFCLNPWPSLFEVPIESVSRNPKPKVPLSPRRGKRQNHELSRRGFHLDSEWQWLCEDCIHFFARDLINCHVRVWWHEDVCAYNGVVDAFEEMSECHRVHYSADDDWEFVSLSQEVFLLKPAIVV